MAAADIMGHATTCYFNSKVLKIPELSNHEVAMYDYQALPIILPCTFLFAKQSDFKTASSTKVLKYGTQFQRALKPSNLLISLKYHIKII